MGVESEIREALINLIFNAVDAMPEGGTLTLRTERRCADSATSPHCASVQVEVSDTGVGMDEETRRRCLEPFFTTKGERGTGLGLAMVYGIVQRHNAEIEIESASGKGTTMRLVFPVPAIARWPIPAATRRIRRAVAPAHSGGGRRSAAASNRCATRWKRTATSVVTANGGQEGIDAFAQRTERGEPFAVVITDLGMPYVDGRKVASAIKAPRPPRRSFCSPAGASGWWPKATFRRTWTAC